MFDGRLVRLRAFEQTDLDANHAFMNDYATLRDMSSARLAPAPHPMRMSAAGWISRRATPAVSISLPLRTAAATWWAAAA